MRILIFGGPFLNAGFRKLGHTVFNAGDKPECDLHCRHPLSALKIYRSLLEQGVAPDMALYCDSGNLPQFFDVEKLPCPIAFYSIDSWCNPWHMPFGQAFDQVFVAQKGHVPLFGKTGGEPAWLPLFFQADKVRPPAREKDVPVVFVGTLHGLNNPDRRPFLEAFRAQHPLIITQGDYAPLFARSRIALNQTAASEINFRCFEAPACGTALLTEECSGGLLDLFTPGEDILPPYPRGDAQAAARAADAALNDPPALERIARQGRELVMRRHSDMHRAGTIVETMLPLMQGEAHRQRLAPGNTARKRLFSQAYFFLALELDKPELAGHKDLYLRLARSLAE